MRDWRLELGKDESFELEEERKKKEKKKKKKRKKRKKKKEKKNFFVSCFCSPPDFTLHLLHEICWEGVINVGRVAQTSASAPSLHSVP